jgi:hypothetical protein
MKTLFKTANCHCQLLLFAVLMAGILFFTSCNDDFLTRQPKSLISEENVWGNGGDRKAIMALLANYYDNVPYECGSDVGHWGQHLSQYCDESMRGYVWGAPYKPTMTLTMNDIDPNDEGLDKIWPYVRIRDINDFLERIVEADIEDKDRFVAEAYFIRAFHYFSLAKRYGGVPIIDHTQAYDPSNFDELKVPRSTEEEVWNFIAQDADLAIAHFNKVRTEAEPYRVNKYAAFALKSRAMLYAATIAKYGTVQLRGLVGVPSEKADDFFRRSLEASDSVIQSGKYYLYDRGGNTPEGKADNFQQLFLEKTMHEEAIVLKYYGGPKFGSFDYFNAPPSYKLDWGCVTNPTLELVEAFEYIDGTPGTLKVYDRAGTSIHYAKPEDIFKDKDPRFFGTVIYSGCPWQGSTVEIRQGVIVGGVKQTASNYSSALSNGTTIAGKDGMITSGGGTETGFYIKKYMDPVNKLDIERSETPQLAMRYAEVLLNYAEAAVELGVKPVEALDCINKIRTRAGIATKAALTLDDVRHERRVELAFENHRFWDIRRWRIATTLMNNTKFHGLFPWLDVTANNYFFETGVAIRNQAKTFLEIDYYFKIPGIDSNEKLVQNPGY